MDGKSLVRSLLRGEFPTDWRSFSFSELDSPSLKSLHTVERHWARATSEFRACLSLRGETLHAESNLQA